MTKSSVKVKYLSTVHPNFRDGLLKGKIEELPDDESVFHNSPQEFYESRPDQSNDPDVKYEQEELIVHRTKKLNKFKTLLCLKLHLKHLY